MTRGKRQASAHPGEQKFLAVVDQKGSPVGREIYRGRPKKIYEPVLRIVFREHFEGDHTGLDDDGVLFMAQEIHCRRSSEAAPKSLIDVQYAF